MAPQMTEYEKTQMYKLVCNDLSVEELYVGHTTNFRTRKAGHKSNSKNPKTSNTKIYARMNETGGFENWSMVLIEAYPCKSAEEARARERYWYEELNARLNAYRPYSSPDEKTAQLREYRDTHKDAMRDYQVAYREENKGKSKAYYEENKDKYKAYYEENKDKYKAYYEENKDATRDYQVAYREINKAEINAKQNAKNQAKKATKVQIIGAELKN